MAVLQALRHDKTDGRHKDVDPGMHKKYAVPGSRGAKQKVTERSGQIYGVDATSFVDRV